MISLRGAWASAAAILGASPGGLAGQESPVLATISTGTATRSGSLSNRVSPELLRPVTDEATTIPATLPPSRAPPLTAAVEPWLVPTSQDRNLRAAADEIDRLADRRGIGRGVAVAKQRHAVRRGEYDDGQAMRLP